MTERIKAHLDALTQNAPKTRRVEEMRQELLAGCLDKYADLTADGMSEGDAFKEVIDGIGDVSELLGHIEKADAFNPLEAEDKHRKRAFFTSCGICLYFLAIAAVILFASVDLPQFGAAVMFLLAGVATMLIVYGQMTTKVKYEKTADTLVEDLKVQMTLGTKEKRLAGLASSSLWCLVSVVYLAVSFFFGYWHLTWILFVIGAACQCVITAWFFPHARGRSLWGAYWCLAVVLYFLVSFATFHWHISWMIFPLAAAAQQSVRLFVAWREEE